MAALATGVILASDVFESGAGVDRLLFGTLLGLGAADLALSGAVAALAAAARSLLGRTWSAVGFDPDGARALGLPAGPRRPPAARRSWRVAAVAAIPAVGALLVTAIYVLPGRGGAHARRAASAGLIACALALALAEGVVGLYLAYWLDVPPGPPIAVLGALVCLCAGAAAARRAPRERDRGDDERLAAATAARPSSRTSRFEAAPGQSVCVLGPNGGGKTTLFRALLGELEPLAGRVERERPPRVRRADRAHAASTSRSPRSTWR